MKRRTQTLKIWACVTGFGLLAMVLVPNCPPGIAGAATSARTATSTEIAITSPSRMYTADFNNDTYPDLVVRQVFGSNRYATVFISDGAGGYLAPNQISIPLVNGTGSNFRISARDFTNDGKVDMVIFQQGINGVFGPSTFGGLKFLQGNGSGGFGPPTEVTANLSPYFLDVDAGDLNGDGKLDLAFPWTGSGLLSPGGASWYYGDGAGGFTSAGGVGLNNAANGLVAGDFTNDGKTDLAVQSAGDSCGDSFCQPALQSLIGDGTGNFTKNTLASLGAASMVTGDFNADGKLDIFSRNGIVLGDGLGGFSRSTTLPGAGTSALTSANNAVAGDFNNDGKLDGALIRGDGAIGLYFGNGAGGLLTSHIYTPGLGAAGLVAADFNHNGKMDLAVSLTTENKIVIYYDDALPNLQNSHVFDIDGDGKTDVAVYRPGNPGVWYYILSSTNTFQAFYFGTTGDVPVAADYSGDNRIDFAVWRPSTGVWYRALPGNPATFYGISTDTPIVGGDYDGNGSADLAVYRVSGGVGTFYINSIGAVNLGTTGDKPVVGDFDGDGKTDVAIYRPGASPTADSTWYIIRSSDHVLTSLNYGIGEDKPVVADFNGDHLSNIAVFRPSTGYWYTTQDPSTNYGGQQFGALGDVPLTGDYDGDGKIDLSVYRNGTWYILTSNTPAVVVYNFGVGSDKPVPAMSLP